MTTLFTYRPSTPTYALIVEVLVLLDIATST